MPIHFISQIPLIRMEKLPDTVKLVVLGSEGVGKTTALERLASGTFDHATLPTVGIQMASLDVVSSSGRPVRVSLVDTAGQERHRSLTPSYLRGSHIVLLCYAVHERDSFADLAYWHSMALDHAAGATVVLAALQNDRELNVQASEGTRFANDIEAPFIEMSSLTGFGFETLIAEIRKAADRACVTVVIQEESNSGCC
jgi:small GTP-binding protein